MIQGFIDKPTPEEKAKWQAAYKEGFQAGKRAALREIKYAVKDIEDLEAFSISTSTILFKDVQVD